MSRYTGPRMRLMRRFGVLPGLSNKEIKRKGRPGQHSLLNSKKSDFALALEEKQKIRFNYGVSEKQLRRYMTMARKSKGLTGEALLRLCEMRLDSIVYRLGFAPTIPAARQTVKHGHISVNGSRVDIPSYSCKISDVIAPMEKEVSLSLVKANMSKRATAHLPAFLNLDTEKLKGQVLSLANREDVILKVNDQLVVEYYAQHG